MKIGFFTSIEGWGGSETYLLSLMRGIREAGHIPVLFGIEGTRLYREAQNVGIECVAWKCTGGEGVNGGGQKDVTGTESRTSGVDRGAGKAKQRMLGCLPQWVKLLSGNIREVMILRKIFRRYPVDVMHVSSSGYEMAGVACRMCRIPSVVMNMITSPYEPYWFRRWLMKITLRAYNHVSSQSAACTSEWIRFARLRAKRCSHVWNGVDLSRFSGVPIPARLASDKFILISVGRLHPMKGYDYLIRALGELKDRRIYLVLLGSGPEEARLKALAVECGVGEQVEFRGHVEDPEVQLRQAHCFVLPSVSHESCPAVVPEAMACGLPVVTSDFGPLPEINIHNETGMVVPARDVNALAEAIRRLSGHPEECNRFGRNGAKRAWECFSRDQMIASMLAIYTDLKK